MTVDLEMGMVLVKVKVKVIEVAKWMIQLV
jgi:hypothetical protein